MQLLLVLGFFVSLSLAVSSSLLSDTIRGNFKHEGFWDYIYPEWSMTRVQRYEGWEYNYLPYPHELRSPSRLMNVKKRSLKNFQNSSLFIWLFISLRLIFRHVWWAPRLETLDSRSQERFATISFEKVLIYLNLCLFSFHCFSPHLEVYFRMSVRNCRERKIKAETNDYIDQRVDSDGI